MNVHQSVVRFPCTRARSPTFSRSLGRPPQIGVRRIGPTRSSQCQWMSQLAQVSPRSPSATAPSTYALRLGASDSCREGRLPPPLCFNHHVHSSFHARIFLVMQRTTHPFPASPVYIRCRIFPSKARRGRRRGFRSATRFHPASSMARSSRRSHRWSPLAPARSASRAPATLAVSPAVRPSYPPSQVRGTGGPLWGVCGGGGWRICGCGLFGLNLISLACRLPRAHMCVWAGSDWWTASDGVQILPFQRCDSIYFHPASQEPIAVKRKQVRAEVCGCLCLYVFVYVDGWMERGGCDYRLAMSILFRSRYGIEA